MSKKDLIKAIEVKTPCSESWDEMQGNDQVRFCSHCSKDVNNLSEMTRKDALRLVRRSGGDLCIRYINDPKTSRPLFSENLYKITRRATGLAAGVMTASLSLSTATYAQGAMVRSPLSLPHLQAGVDPAGKRTVPAPETVTISGTVTDEQGKAIPRATIVLSNDESGRDLTLTTDENGSYEIRNISNGKYTFTITAAGYETYVVRDISSAGGHVVQNAALKTSDTLEVVTITSGYALILPTQKIRNPLSLAVMQDDSEETKNILANSVNVNVKERNYEGATPLFMAVENGNFRIVEMLLNLGARVNARDKNRQTPIMRIDADANARLVNLLVRHGAQVNLADKKGNTALILATEDQPDVSVIRALLDAGADVNHRNNAGETALMKAAANDDLEAVRTLILAGADVNLTNRTGDTAWDIATDPKVTELLEIYGGRSGDPEETDDSDTLDSR